MVMRSTRAFGRSDSGVALTEGLIVFPIVVLAISVCVEFGYVVYQWNTAAKAMQLGVRKLVVSQPVIPNFGCIFASSSDPTAAGQPVSADGISASCGAGTNQACDAAQITRLNLSRFGIQNNQIRVTYQRSGLGYNGRPEGAVVTVRMDVVRTATNLPVVGALLNTAGISFPSFTVTATSEDLRNSPLASPPVQCP
ncbi:MAG: TadE/TadG family type IV pilus assembly protein [Mesorhizobium sp.]